MHFKMLTAKCKPLCDGLNVLMKIINIIEHLECGMGQKGLLDHMYISEYLQTSDISLTLVGNEIVDHSDVVGAAPVAAAPTTSSFSPEHLASMAWAKTTTKWHEKHLCFVIWCHVY